MIYIIQAQNGFIKIGSAADPHSRFKKYLPSSPLQLRLIAILPGGITEEVKLHRRFDDSRQHNEWFAPDGEILKFVADIWGQGLDHVADWVSDYRAVREAAKENAKVLRSEAHKRLWADPEYRKERAADRARMKKRRHELDLLAQRAGVTANA